MTKIVATCFSAEEVRELRALLEQGQIPCETQAGTGEDGFETTNLLVAEEDYERACGIIEARETAREVVSRQLRGLRCPRCGSVDFNYVQDPLLAAKEVTAMKCRHCGEMFSR